VTWINDAYPIQLKRAADALFELSDIPTQRQLWNSTGHPEWSSFTEAVEELLDDSGLGSELSRGRSGLSPETVQAIGLLTQQLRRVPADRYPDEVINDPSMAEVRFLARRAWELLCKEPGYSRASA
jgi:hypothetical protein